MNLNRLEMLYFVVKHGGITPAAREIPWGISASAISKQITALEQSERVKLFTRGDTGRFELLPAGKRYYDAFAPLYEELQRVAAETTGLTGKTLRVGASPYVLQQYLAPLLGVLRRRHPDLPLEFVAGGRALMEDCLRRGEIDVAVITVEEPPTDWHWQPLLQRPVVMFVPADSTATDGWQCLEQGARLVAPLPSEAVSRRLFSALRQRNAQWPVAIRASETGEVPVHVQAGGCVGPAVAVGALTSLPQVRVLPLAGVEPVTVGAVWRDEPNGLRTLLQLAVDAAQKVIDLAPMGANGVPVAIDTGASSYVPVTVKRRQTSKAASKAGP